MMNSRSERVITRNIRQ